jgi:hypothetical protein
MPTILSVGAWCHLSVKLISGPQRGKGGVVETGVIDMAKVKQKPKPVPSRGPRTVGVRATGEWADWLERAARHCRTDVAKLLDAAVADYVKLRGFNELPPERIP